MSAARGAVSDTDLPTWIRVGAAAVSIEVMARPGASRSTIVRTDPRGIVIAIAAPPEKGKANDELIRFVAQLADVDRSAVSILRGETSRNKIVRIAARDPAAIARAINIAAKAGRSTPSA